MTDAKALLALQPFERYPKLAGMIENIGWKAHGISISTWGAFLAEINSVISSLESDRLEAEMRAAQPPTMDIILAWYKTLPDGARQKLSLAHLHALSKSLLHHLARPVTPTPTREQIADVLHGALVEITNYRSKPQETGQINRYSAERLAKEIEALLQPSSPSSGMKGDDE